MTKNNKLAGRELRQEERVSAAVPVDLGGVAGTTRDLSASGVFIETDASFAPGNEVGFVIHFDTPGGKITLHCQGEIVRREAVRKGIGLAIKINESTITRPD